MNAVVALMMTLGCTGIVGGAECLLYAYMPTYFGPSPSALIASATVLARVSTRLLTPPIFPQSSHSHQFPPSLGSIEIESAFGFAVSCRTACSATSLRRSGLETQNFKSPPRVRRSPLLTA